ncbi:hydrogenase [Candidatus Sumerlaeota bacterium]|nr:hydrogenase [Candidatus Sumerlaeota bacterium]
MKLLLLFSLSAYPVTAVLSLLPGRRSQLSGWINPAGSMLAALLGFFPAMHALGGGAVEFQSAWSFPIGSFHLRLDALSAWFCLPMLMISALAASYGRGYMRHSGDQTSVNLHWFFFQLLSGGVYLTLMAWDAILFLIAWEVMSLSAWFLVMFDHENPTVQRAGWIYLAATQLGTAFLLIMFVMLGADGGGLDFTLFLGTSRAAGLVFIFAVLGFGAKAGFFGLHVWLPEAHPAAPSHVSGLMSGVMIKMGVYGLLRILTMLPAWAEWWGWLLIGAGAVSGLGGALFAMAQHDIKRLLAYSSVENIGIVCLGLGMGMLGFQHQCHTIALLGMAGAMLHVLNHSIFKTALFMGAGSVAHATGAREIDLLGGLQKRMPVTAAIFMLAAAAICGLPPLNGFISEMLIFLAAFRGVMLGPAPDVSVALGGIAVVVSLGLTGGLAMMCFANVFGVVFLGEARHACCEHAHEAPWSMRLPMSLLAAACVLAGLGGFWLIQLAASAAVSIHPAGMNDGAAEMLLMETAVLLKVSALALGLIVVFLLLSLARSRLLRDRDVRNVSTWGCGYASPSPRMQYTGSSFVQPALHAFRLFFRVKTSGDPPSGRLPVRARFSSYIADPWLNGFYEPLLKAAAAGAVRLRRIQHGRVHYYVLYLILALIAILIWSLH